MAGSRQGYLALEFNTKVSYFGVPLTQCCGLL